MRPLTESANEEVPTQEERELFLEHVRSDGQCSIGAAAAAAGPKRRRFKDLLQSDPEFKADYYEARGWSVTKVESTLFEIATDKENAQATRAIAMVLGAHHPDYADKRQIELSGAGGGPIEIEGRAVVGLADVVRLARELPGVSAALGLDAGAPGRALPPAQDVLPDPPERLRPPGALPPP